MTAPRLVLLRPRNADNLGAVARAMKNFSLSDWVVVSPNPKLLEAPGMHSLAVKAGDLLETVRRVDTFEEAVADCSWVVGTTMRKIEGHRRLFPEEVAAEAHGRNDEKWALVFGDERHGLTNDDVKLCHALSTISTSPEQPSLNLAQSVVVYGHAWYSSTRPAVHFAPAQVATDAALQVLGRNLKTALQSATFLDDTRDDAFQALMSSLIRARLTKREANLWTAAMHRVAQALASPAHEE
jgi:TrmH family RNA methyltransferase